jgi:glycosyltransferase involved in cell wall biosynthesis
LYGTSDDLIQKQRYQYLGNQVDFLMRVYPIPEQMKGKAVQISNYGIHIIAVPTFSRVSTFYNRFKAKSIIKESIRNYDILIIRLPSANGSLALKYARFYHIPYVVEVVACSWDSLRHYSLLGKIYAPFSYFKHKRLIKKSPYVMYVTDHFLQKRYPNRHNNINVSDVMIDDSDNCILEEKIKHYQNVKKSSPVILATFAAVDINYKGQQYVLKAIATLLDSGYTFFYELVGGGNNEKLKRKAIKLGIQNSVIFEGAIDHNDVSSFLDQVDIYIQPSKTEGLPRALVEAMSRGCACIGSNAGGIPELLEDHCIFKKGNTDDLIRVLKSMLDGNRLVLEAQRNFLKAKNFEEKYLSKKRNAFYDQFLEENKQTLK